MFEYKMILAHRGILQQPGEPDSVTRTIMSAATSLGREGWEMAGIFPTEDGAAVYFKRTRPEEA